jgi:copper chaperone NosL
MTAWLSFRGTPASRVPRNPQSPRRRTPRRPVMPKLLGVTGAGPLLLGMAAGIMLALFACGGGAPEPAALDTRNEACASCRMAVSTAVFASQIVAPGELPRFFDDLGCLGDFLKAGKAPAGATAFVADHRTRAWVRADRAVYTRVPGLETPMGSHAIAHADAASRDQDPVARGGSSVAPAELFGPAGPPIGGPR